MFCFDEFILCCHWQIHANIFFNYIIFCCAIWKQDDWIYSIMLWIGIDLTNISNFMWYPDVYTHCHRKCFEFFINHCSNEFSSWDFQFQNNASLNFILFFDSKVAPLKYTQSMQTQALDRQILNALMLIWILFCFFHRFNVSLQSTIKI